MTLTNLAFSEDWEGEMNIKGLFCIYYLINSSQQSHREAFLIILFIDEEMEPWCSS